MKYQAIVNTPIGSLGINIVNDSIVNVNFLPQEHTAFPAQEPMAKKIIKELEAYFANSQATFTVNLQLKGTDFQKRVWQALQAIPAGKTLTYGELAKQLKSSARAVGNACRRNPVPVIVPCHRVLAKNGIGGFAGATSGDLLNIKQWLLKHEGAL